MLITADTVVGKFTDVTIVDTAQQNSDNNIDIAVYKY